MCALQAGWMFGVYPPWMGVFWSTLLDSFRQCSNSLIKAADLSHLELNDERGADFTNSINNYSRDQLVILIKAKLHFIGQIFSMQLNFSSFLLVHPAEHQRQTEKTAALHSSFMLCSRFLHPSPPSPAVTTRPQLLLGENSC